MLQDTHRLADKISEMAGVMRLAADIDETNSNCAEEHLARLRTENAVSIHFFFTKVPKIPVDFS